MTLTKQDLEAIKGVMTPEFDIRLTPIEKKLFAIEQDIKEIKNDLSGLREQIQQLAITLDNFVKMMTDYKEEFVILKAEVDQIKKVLKEKLGVEIAVQS